MMLAAKADEQKMRSACCVAGRFVLSKFNFLFCIALGTLAPVSAQTLATPAMVLSGKEAIAELDRELAKYDRCIDSSDGITANMADCNGTTLESLESLMNRTLATVAGRLSPLARRHFQASQRAWKARREPKCWYGLDHSSGYYGTMEMLLFQSCLVGADEDRIRWLVKHFKQR